ncbi:unannotated protein [freshwater metagenome]|uniref:Unannotated protein n=1 Tax=freshwater metagenome TaxID=449393 RepID=A0A6J7J409_9ZZZZ
MRKSAHQTPATQLPGVKPEFTRCRVHEPFHGQRLNRARDATVGRDGTFVRQHRARPHRVVLDGVGPRKLGHCHERLDPKRHRVAGVGAHVSDDVSLQGHETALLEPPGHPVDLLAAVPGRQEVLRPRLNPGDRRAQRPRDVHERDILASKSHLAAEGTADIGCDNAQRACGDSERVADAGAHHVRHLRRGGEGRATGSAIEGRHRSACLQRHRRLPMAHDLDGRVVVALCPRVLEVGRSDPTVDNGVRVTWKGKVVHRARTGADGEIGREDGVNRIDVDLNHLGEILRLSWSSAQDHCHRLADEPHHSCCKDRHSDRHVVRTIEYRRDGRSGEVRRREEVRTNGPTDPANRTGSHAAANEDRVPLGVNGAVSHEAPLASQNRRVIESRQPPPDPRRDAHGVSPTSERRVSARTRSRRKSPSP